jgi:hypothetical protein
MDKFIVLLNRQLKAGKISKYIFNKELKEYKLTKPKQ